MPGSTDASAQAPSFPAADSETEGTEGSEGSQGSEGSEGDDDRAPRQDRSLADVIDRVQQRLAASQVPADQKAALTARLDELAQGAVDGTATWETARPLLEEIRQAIHDSRPVENVTGEEAKSKLDNAIDAIKNADIPEEVKAQLISQLTQLRDSADDTTASKIIEDHKAERFAHVRDKISNAADHIGTAVDDALAAGKIDAATAAAFHERLDANKAAAAVATSRTEMRAAWRGVKSVWVELHQIIEADENESEGTDAPETTSTPDVPETTSPAIPTPTNTTPEPSTSVSTETQPPSPTEPAETTVQP
jgi:hypothetical protein